MLSIGLKWGDRLVATKLAPRRVALPSVYRMTARAPAVPDGIRPRSPAWGRVAYLVARLYERQTGSYTEQRGELAPPCCHDGGSGVKTIVTERGRW